MLGTVECFVWKPTLAQWCLSQSLKLSCSELSSLLSSDATKFIFLNFLATVGVMPQIVLLNLPLPSSERKWGKVITSAPACFFLSSLCVECLCAHQGTLLPLTDPVHATPHRTWAITAKAAPKMVRMIRPVALLQPLTTMVVWVDLCPSPWTIPYMLIWSM